jgi:hypothetical protein
VLALGHVLERDRADRRGDVLTMLLLFAVVVPSFALVTYVRF